jgi:hypothetical protein
VGTTTGAGEAPGVDERSPTRCERADETADLNRSGPTLRLALATLLLLPLVLCGELFAPIAELRVGGLLRLHRLVLSVHDRQGIGLRTAELVVDHVELGLIAGQLSLGGHDVVDRLLAAESGGIEELGGGHHLVDRRSREDDPRVVEASHHVHLDGLLLELVLDPPVVVGVRVDRSLNSTLLGLEPRHLVESCLVFEGRLLKCGPGGAIGGELLLGVTAGLIDLGSRHCVGNHREEGSDHCHKKDDEQDAYRRLRGSHWREMLTTPGFLLKSVETRSRFGMGLTG